MNKGIEDAISKSLDEIDTIVAGMNQNTDMNKSVGGDPAPDEVSKDTPEAEENSDENPDTADAGAEGAGEEGDGADTNTDADTDNQGEENTDEANTDNTEKSLEEALKSNESVRKSLEVSEFLQELVKSLSGALGSQGTELAKSIATTESANMLLAKSLEGLVKSQKAVLETQARMLKSQSTILDRLNKIESQPMTKKSITTKKSQVVNKSFEASLGGKPEGESNTLTKSEAVTRLTSAYESGNTSVMNDILALESVGDMGILSAEAKAVLNIK